jgi:hypothetical protein
MSNPYQMAQPASDKQDGQVTPFWFVSSKPSSEFRITGGCLREIFQDCWRERDGFAGVINTKQELLLAILRAYLLQARQIAQA